MNANALLGYSLRTSWNQVTKVFEGTPPELLTHRITPHAMTPLEMIEHLAECCHAYLELTRGRKHQWGSFSLPAHDLKTAWLALSSLRHECDEVVQNMDDPSLLEQAIVYLVSHESYHVGQMCLLRMEVSPGWNPYSIYDNA